MEIGRYASSLPGIADSGFNFVVGVSVRVLVFASAKTILADRLHHSPRVDHALLRRDFRAGARKRSADFMDDDRAKPICQFQCRRDDVIERASDAFAAETEPRGRLRASRGPDGHVRRAVFGSRL